MTSSTKSDTPTVMVAPQAQATINVAEQNNASEPTSSSSSESETTTGVDADTEESMTSEEETDKLQTKEIDGKREKWVAVKGSPTAVVTPASATISANELSWALLSTVDRWFLPSAL